MKRLLAGVLAMGLCVSAAHAVTLSNGFATTDGRHFSIDYTANAFSDAAFMRAPGQGLVDIMKQTIPFVVTGSTSARLSGGEWIDSDGSDGQITSGGSMGALGFNWTATHTMNYDPIVGSYVTTQYSFSGINSSTLPEMRFYQYVDMDFIHMYNNQLKVEGTLSDPDFALVAVQPDLRREFYTSPDDQATGWAASNYSSLRGFLTHQRGYDVPAEGDLNGLVPVSHPHYGLLYGNRWATDLTYAIEWTIPAGLTDYTLEVTMGPRPVHAPEPATMGLVLLGVGGLAALRRRAAERRA